MRDFLAWKKINFAVAFKIKNNEDLTNSPEKKGYFITRIFHGFFKKLSEQLFTEHLYVAASGLLKWQVKMTEIIFKGVSVAKNCLRPVSAPLRESGLFETTSFPLKLFTSNYYFILYYYNQ